MPIDRRTTFDVTAATIRSTEPFNLSGLCSGSNSTCWTAKPDDESSSALTPYYQVAVWEAVVAAVGTPLNLIVLYFSMLFIARERRRMRSVAAERSSIQYYIFNMTLADLMFTGLHAPVFAVMYIANLTFNPPLCRFYYIVTHTSTVCSSLTLMALNVDKFVAVSRPLHRSLILGKRTIYGLLTLTWLVSVSWALLLTFGPLLSISDICNVTLVYSTAYYVFTVVFFVLPIIFSFFISVYILCVAGRFCNDEAAKLLEKHRLQPRSSTGNSSSSKPAGKKIRARTVIFIFSTTVWSLVTTVPYRLSFLLHLLDVTDTDLSMALFGVMAANAFGNPFITLATQRQYRTRFWQLFRCGRSLRRPSGSPCTGRTELSRRVS